MRVGDYGGEGSLENALSQCARFDLERNRAIEEWMKVADRVSQWKTVFASVGVTSPDIDYLADFIDFEDRAAMRRSRQPA